MSGRKHGAVLPGVPWQAGVRRLLDMARGGTVVAGSAAGAIAGLGYYLWVPKPSSTLCDQAIFVDQAADVSLFPDAVLVEIDRLG